jgi:hypothetical protein
MIELILNPDDEDSIKFRAMVANILRFIRGEDVPDMHTSIVEYVEASERSGPLRIASCFSFLGRLSVKEVRIYNRQSCPHVCHTSVLSANASGRF